MKKRFILGMGMGWCGSSSLWNTLLVNNYIDTGIRKEVHALVTIDDFYNLEGFLNIRRFYEKNKILLFNTVKTDKWAENPAQKVVDIHNKFYDKIFDKEKTILQNYIDYIKAITETTEAQCAADFSVSNAKITKKLLEEFKSKLENEGYEIKILAILRDPVRRGFSYLQSEYVRLKRSNISMLDYVQKHMHTSCGFINSINNYEDVFGNENVWVGFMEEFFDPEKRTGKYSVTGLEEFLNFKLPLITPCVYVPDRGINAPKLPGLEDQSRTDTLKLLPTLYQDYKNLLQPEYDAFEKKYGFIPDFWGSPIDYDY